MQLIVRPVGIYQANCYIIWDETTKESVIIDPGGDFTDLKRIIEEKNLIIKSILLTHAHADHIGAVSDLKRTYNAEILVHKDDYKMLKNSIENHSNVIGTSTIEITADKKIEHGDKILIGNIELKIIHTPGHSKGSISVKCRNKIFTGDTLFAGSIGRTDLEGGSYKEIIKSIKERILIYPDDTLIYPGHGPSTTIKIEKKNNPFLQ